jgi:UPF0755 protein
MSYIPDTNLGAAERGNMGARRARAEREGARPRGPRRPRRALRLIVFSLVVLLVIGVAAGLYVKSYFSTGQPGKMVAVTIPQGATLTQIAQILERAGVVPRAGAFEIRVQTDGYGGDLQAGDYRLHVNQPYASLVTTLRQGPPDTSIKVTIPEGYTARQTAALLAGKIPGFSAEQYVDLTLVHPLPFRFPGFRSGRPLEGFLFPATYEVQPSIKPRGFIEQQLAVFRENMAKVGLARARAKNLTGYDVVTIGSMVEREIQAASERALGAAVVWNRLHLRMRLQIDATVEYALPAYKANLTYQDLKVDSPYNTYLHAGLPPTPIANPGLAALHAAAHPAGVGYLYYVARNDGSGRHYWSSSYAQFLRDKARAQQ